METYQIAVIPGDGIGPEVISGGLTVLQRAAELTGSFALKTTEYPWSCEWYLAHGRMSPRTDSSGCVSRRPCTSARSGSRE